MAENTVANPTPAKAEASSSEPAGQPSTKKSNYHRRNQEKKRQKNNTGGYPTAPVRSKFTGRTAELKDHIFAMGSNSGAIFSKSKKEFLLHVDV